MADHFSLRTYALFILALLAAMLLCVCVGSVSVAPKDTLTAIFCALLGKPAPAGVAKNIIVNVRLPRVMNVALVGASLSLCGAAMQGLLRNPLADGSTLGVSAGASLGAVIALALGVGNGGRKKLIHREYSFGYDVVSLSIHARDQKGERKFAEI